MHRYKKINSLLFLGKMVKKNTKIKVNNLCRNWGIFLIIVSIIQFIFLDIFDVYWAVLVLLVGIITLVFRKSWNLALIGGMFLLVGVYNIITVLLAETLYSFLFGGIIQIGIGIFVLNQYHKIKEKEPDEKEEKVWYKRWWIIVIFIFIGFFLIEDFFLSPERYLEGEGYKVNFFYCTDKDWTEESILEGISSVSMNSLGNREDQITDALISLSESCPPSKTIFVTILEPTKECFYSFNGEVVRLLYEGIGQDNQLISDESKRIIENDISFFLWKSEAKHYFELESMHGISDMTFQQRVISSAYKDYLENGVTRKTIYSIIDYERNGQFNCE